MNIFIVILHYGDIAVTIQCIHSLFTSDNKFTEIILVNNTNQHISSSNFSIGKNSFSIINNKKNLGFAAGANIGIQYALSKNAEYILLLNNDTVIENELIKSFTDFFDKEKQAGIVGSVIAFLKNGKYIYDLGGKINFLFGRTTHEEYETIPYSAPRKVTYISGCCMMIKKEVFERIGYFDEKFFLYYEDADFCLRARNNGFMSFILTTVSIHHELSKAAGNVSPFSVYHQTKSGILFGKKYCKEKRIFNVVFLLAQSILIFIKSPLAGIAAFRGMKDGLVK